MVEEAEAKLAQARASEEVAKANLLSAQAKLAEVQAGIDEPPPRSLAGRRSSSASSSSSTQQAQTGSLRDETRSKLEAAAAAREEIDAQVKTAEAAVRQCEAMVEKARSDVVTAAATIKVARLDARRLGAMRDIPRSLLRTTASLPGGNVDVGDLTTPGTQGQPLFAITRDDLVRISVSVPEMFATEVDPGDRVLIRLQAIPGKNFEGKVARTSWTLDAKNRTLRTEIDVPNPKGILRPGLYAYATVIVEEHPAALSVPTSAIVRQESQIYCVVVADGKAVRKPVTPGFEDGTSTEILSGLDDEDTVVKAYAASLQDGQPVEAGVTEPAKAKP